LYERLKAYCLTHDVGMSTIVEELLRKHFEMEPRTKPAPSVSAKESKVSVRLPEVSAKVSTVSERLSETKPKSSWVPAIELPAAVAAPVSRVETIKEVVEAKKVEPPPGDKASKIFTF
jgi:hypothetical protein